MFKVSVIPPVPLKKKLLESFYADSKLKSMFHCAATGIVTSTPLLSIFTDLNAERHVLAFISP